MTDTTAVAKQFRSRARTFERSARWVCDQGLLSLHKKLAGVCRKDRILDVCCGTGVVGRGVSAPGTRTIGLDLSLSMLSRAKKKLRRCVSARAERLPFADNIFDVVLCRQAFHFLNMRTAVRELVRVAKAGTGRIVISQIVPFGAEDRAWVRKIHSAKQPLLKNFLCENDLQSALAHAGCRNIRVCEYFTEECVNSWLRDTFFSGRKMRAVRMLFERAPAAYKRLHRTRMADGKIFDTMRWVVIRADKALRP